MYSADSKRLGVERIYLIYAVWTITLIQMLLLLEITKKKAKAQGVIIPRNDTWIS